MGRLCALLQFLGAALVVGASFLLPSFPVPLTPWRLPSPVACGVGGTFLLVGVLLFWLGPRVGVAANAATISIISVFAAGYHAPRRGDVELRHFFFADRTKFSNVDAGAPVSSALAPSSRPPVTLPRIWTSPLEWNEQYTRPHHRYGFAGLPNASARQHHRDFDVVYHLDDEGWRVTPAPRDPISQRAIVFVGCSITFGHGVEDDEAFPAILAREAWPRVIVKNRASTGWGTTQCALLVEDELQKQTKPLLIAYGYYCNHPLRNYLRQSYHKNHGAGVPLFTINSPRPAFVGVVDNSAANLPDSTELDRIENELTLHLLHRMKSACESQSVPFVILLLRNETGRCVREMLSDSDLTVIDLSEVSQNCYPHDHHPTATWHRRIAEAIARDRRFCRVAGLEPVSLAEKTKTSEERNRSDAHVSGANALEVNFDAGWASDPRNHADFTGPFSTDRLIEVRQIRCPSHTPWHIRIALRPFAVRESATYTFRAEMRASQPSWVEVVGAEDIPPCRNRGLYARVPLDSSWRAVSLTFPANATDPNLQVNINLGESEGDFAIRRFELVGR